MAAAKLIVTYGPVLQEHERSFHHLLFVTTLLKQGYNVITVTDESAGCFDSSEWPVPIYSGRDLTDEDYRLFQEAHSCFFFWASSFICKLLPVSCTKIFLLFEPWSYRWLSFSKGLDEIWVCTDAAEENLPVYLDQSKLMRVRLDPCLSTCRGVNRSDTLKVLIPVLYEHAFDTRLLNRYTQSLLASGHNLEITVLTDKDIVLEGTTIYRFDLQNLIRCYYDCDIVLDLTSPRPSELNILCAISNNKPIALLSALEHRASDGESLLYLDTGPGLRGIKANVRNILSLLSPHGLSHYRHRLSALQDKLRRVYLLNMDRILNPK